MKLLFTAIIMFFSVQSFAQLTCDVTLKKHTQSGVQEQTIRLEPQEHQTGQVVHRGEIENIHFSMRQAAENEYLAIISEGPDYTHGTTVRSGFTPNNQLRISLVFQNTIYSLLCTK